MKASSNIIVAPEAWPLEMADEVSKVHHVCASRPGDCDNRELRGIVEIVFVRAVRSFACCVLVFFRSFMIVMLFVMSVSLLLYWKNTASNLRF